MSLTIEDRLRKRIVEAFDLSANEVQLTSRLVEDLGADSLALVELVLSAEDEFNLDIPDEDTELLRTVGDAVEYLKKRLPSEPSSGAAKGGE